MEEKKELQENEEEQVKGGYYCSNARGAHKLSLKLKSMNVCCLHCGAYLSGFGLINRDWDNYYFRCLCCGHEQTAIITDDKLVSQKLA